MRSADIGLRAFWGGVRIGSEGTPANLLPYGQQGVVLGLCGSSPVELPIVPSMWYPVRSSETQHTISRVRRSIARAT